MSRCECGQLLIPTGDNVTLKFYQGGTSTSMTLAHRQEHLVLDGYSLSTYGTAPASPAVVPDRILIELGSSPLYLNSVLQIIITVDGKTLASRYIGVKYDYWRLPEIAGVPTIAISCRSILRDISIAGKKVSVQFKSVCDLVSGDCCSDELGSIELISHRKRACAVPTTTPEPVTITYRYTPDCSVHNCREDVNGEYASFHNCREALDCPPTTTTTTAAPTTTSAPPSTTTTTTTTLAP